MHEEIIFDLINRSLEYLVGCKIKCYLTKITLNIYQPRLITITTQGFNEDVKSIMTFNVPATPHKVIVRNQETDTKV